MNKNVSWIIVMISLVFALTVNASAQTLLLKYDFNETGTSITNSGSATGATLTFYDSSGANTDLHAASGSGVGGSGSAFDNSAVVGMGSASGAKATASTTTKSANLGAVQSFTIAGWYNASVTPGNSAKLIELFGTDSNNSIAVNLNASNKIGLYVEGTTLASNASSTYSNVGSWVFFAVTYDGTISLNNVNFYVGTTTTSLSLVSTGTLDKQDITFGGTGGTSAVGIGIGNGYYNSGNANRPTDGLVDAFSVYSSSSDALGALSSAQIETLRLSAIPEPSTVALVILASLSLIFVNKCRHRLSKMGSTLSIILVSISSLCFAQEKILVQSDWKSANSGPYAENARIGNGNNAFFVKSPVDFMVSVDEAGSDKVVRFTNNMGKAGVAGLLANIPELSSDKIDGKLKLKVLPLKEGKRGTLIFAINSARANTTGKDVTAVQITVASDLTLLANNGQSEFAKWDKKLSVGETYEIRYQANFGDAAQDTFEFTLHDASGTELFKSGTLKTRAPNITPGALILLGASTDAKSADPFIEIQEVSLAQK